MPKESQNAFISWGAGVNSTAIIALYRLGILEGKPEIVFADTGGELPETYQYINNLSEILRADGWEITTLHPLSFGHLYSKRAVGKELYDLLWEIKTVPGIKWRFCTSEYKRDPLGRYARGRKKMIGICGDELKRMRDDPKAIYPLHDYTRDDCINLIAAAGLPKAHKTGCYFCPFQPKAQWLSLFDNHPKLYRKVIDLENNSERWRIFSNGRSVGQQIEKWLRERTLDAAQIRFDFGDIRSLTDRCR